jgi:hypothetical protein
VVIEVSSNPRLAQDLAAGGVFVPGCSFQLNDECELVVRGASSEVRLAARVVYADEVRGTGFELLRVDAETKALLAAALGAPVEMPVRKAVTSTNPPMRNPTPAAGRRIVMRAASPVVVAPVEPEPPAPVEPPAFQPPVELPDDEEPAQVHSAKPVAELETERYPALEAAPPEATHPITRQELEDELAQFVLDSDDEPPARAEQVAGTEPVSTETASTEPTPTEAAGTEAAGTEPPGDLPPDVEAAINKASGGTDAKFARNVHERMRGLTLVQQVKLAQHGEQHERIVLERMYGKNVWEALLRNPRLTGQEVARIARMGALPRPLIETICGNGGWLQIPEVRRALLGNPRLGTDQIMKVLRLTPKHELRLVPQQTAYTLAVRDVARRLLREQE